MKVYRLEIEDLSNIGGRMGSEETTISHVGTYFSANKARKAAEAHYKAKDGRVLIKWKDNKTQDLLSCRYRVVEEKLL